MTAENSGVYVLSGPTAVGKGTVVAKLRERCPDLWLSTSVTTRAQRPGEIDGVHYHFISEAEFENLRDTGGLLEWAWVHGSAHYGTPRRPVEEALAAGRTVLLEIDLQGARQVRDSWPGANFIFLAPPSWLELVRRLEGRGTETAEQRERRLTTARAELTAQGEFDHVIVNGTVRQAVEALVGLLGLRPSSIGEGTL